MKPSTFVFILFMLHKKCFLQLKPFKVSKKRLQTSICTCLVPFANIQARGIGNELPKHEDNYGPGGEVVDLNVKKLQEPPAESNPQKNQQLQCVLWHGFPKSKQLESSSYEGSV